MSPSPAPARLFETLFGTAEMRRLFSDETHVQQLVRVEAALARVQGELGVVPREAAEVIVQRLATFSFDLDRLRLGTERSGIPTIELLKQLRGHVGGEAASYIHFGATSQDIMDTATVLQIGQGLEHLEDRLKTLVGNLIVLSRSHATTVMAGRTHGQQAVPLTFGFKVANWLAPLLRHLDRSNELRRRVLVLQFGGAVGTLAALGDRGIAVQQALAEELGLIDPIAPWHTQRDGFAELAGWLSLVTGSLGKVAQDVISMAQSEIAELRESNDPQRGGSSTMPQKSNPVQSELIVAAARHNAQLLATMHHALIQEHERGTHGWQLEWLALPQMFGSTASALERSVWLSENLVVDAERMKTNVARSQGAMLAEHYSYELARHQPRADAKALVTEAARESARSGRHLADVLTELSDAPVDWASTRDEAAYLGAAEAFTERVIRAAEQVLR